MKKPSIKFSSKKQTMRRKLFLYMTILSTLLLLALVISLFAIGSITNTSARLSNTLHLQLEVFEHDIKSYYNSISFQCAKLSDNLSAITDDYLNSNNISFESLNNSNKNIQELESAYMKVVKEYLLKTDCSGSFVILNTTRGKQGEHSKASTYLKRNMFGFNVKDKLLLYSGSVKEAKKLKIMPHRKWNLEFDINYYPNYYDAISNSVDPIERACSIDGIIELPGTSEQVMLISIPIRGKDGKNYGICGYEISSDIFKAMLSQPTTLKHLTCLFSKNTNSQEINVNEGFSCGVSGGYYKSPKGILTLHSFSEKNNLVSLTNEYNSYIGMTKNVNLYNDNSSYRITAMVPRTDYVQVNIIYIIKIISLILIIGTLLISASLYFSRQYILPIIRELEKIKQLEPLSADTNILEIVDLFDFLSKKDNIHESSIKQLVDEKHALEEELNSIQKKLDTLANESNQNIQPDEYEFFKQNINQLTKTESIIFKMYLDGKKSDEITKDLNIKISTLKFHNHNIYQKLGVKSRKQLIKLATLLEKERKSE